MALSFRTRYKHHSLDDLRKRSIRRMQRMISRIKVEPKLIYPGQGTPLLDSLREQAKEKQQ